MSIVSEQIIPPHPTPRRANGYFLTAHDGTDRIAYCIDNLIYIRGLTNVDDVDLYIGHAAKTTACSYCPSGRWIASADETGTVRVWTPQNAEKTLELETRPISGPIFDISWTGDNQRISIVGAGANNAYGCVLNAETGSSQGEVIGHTKQVNTCCLKPNRPFKFVTAGDDLQHIFYKGPPFKFDHTCKDHDRFILCARYAPDGSVYATTGLDGKVCIYDGKESTKINIFQFPCGVTTIAFSPDSKQALLSMMDGRALVINVADGSVAEEYNIGADVYQQQAGAIWTSKHKMTISLNGDFNFLEDGKVRTEMAHAAGISAMVLIDGGLVTGDSRGMVLLRKFGEIPYAVYNPEGIEGTKPAVNTMAANADKSLIYVGCGDQKIYVIRAADASVADIIDIKKPVKQILPYGSDFIVLSAGEILLLKGTEATPIKTPFPTTAVAISPKADEIVIGGAKGAIAVIGVDGSVKEQTKGHDYDVVALTYSQDGGKIASSSSHKDIAVFDRNNMKESIHEGWCFHSLPVTRILFTADGEHLITVSGDRSIREWSLAKKRKYVVVDRAHQQKITDAAWLDQTHIITTSEDGAIKKWNVELI